MQQLQANARATLEGVGPARRDTDLADDRQFRGNWFDFSHRCAHAALQEPQVINLIKLKPMTRQRCAAIRPIMPLKSLVPHRAPKVHS